MALQVRNALNSDLPILSNIEKLAKVEAWDLPDFEAAQRRSGTYITVVEYSGGLAGYAVFELHNKWLQLINIAVHPEYRYLYVGRTLIEDLIRRLEGRLRITALVRDSNLGAHLFFQRCGFISVAVLRNHFEDPQEDAYEFEFDRRKQQLPKVARVRKRR